MAFRLLVYHDLPEFAAEELRKNGIEIKRGLEPTEEGICRDIEDCDALVAFEQPKHGFNRAIIDAAPRLKLIARRGVGYETEAAIMLMLEGARNAQKVNEKFRRERAKYQMFTSDIASRGFELTGRTLGIIGCGNIGRHVAQIASCGFGMRVLGYDAYAGELPEYIERVEEADRIFREADFVSLHLPSTPQTRQSIGRRQFEMMKNSAVLINTSRGDVICEEELIAALEKKKILGAGLDVYASEPISEAAYPLFDMDRVAMTPHNASFTVESLYNAVRSVVKSVLEVAEGKKPECAVNDPEHPRAAVRS